MERWAAILVCASLLGSCARSVKPDLAKAPTRDLRLALILAPSFRDDGLTCSLREGFKSVIVVENTKQAKATRADLFGTVGPEEDLRLMRPDFEPVEAIPLTRLRQALLESSKLAAFAQSLRSKPPPVRTRRTEVKAPPPDADVPTYKNAPQPDDFALVIGAAGAAQKDVEAVRSHLAALGYPEGNIMLLAGEGATRAAIADAVESWLPKNIRRKSHIFFYYTGNGAGDPESGQAYLFPQDADLRFLATTAYPVKRLLEKFNAMDAKEVAVVLDAGLPETDAPKGKLTVLAAPGATRRLLEKLNETGGTVGLRELFRLLR